MNGISLPLQLQNVSFILLSIAFGIIAILFAYHKKYAKELVLSVISQRYANHYLRDDNVFKRRTNILFTLLMILNISFCIWSSLNYYKETNLSFFSTFFYVSLYYSIKYISILLLGFLIHMKQIALLTQFFTSLFDKVLSLMLFPILLFFHFYVTDLKDELIILILIFFVLFFMLKIFWILKIGIKSFGLSRFYLFLYICILELFPLVLIFREIIFA